MNPHRFWKGVVVGLGAIDCYAAFVKHDGTASHVIRETFRTDTTTGKVALCLFWAGLTLAVLPHWCTWPADRLPPR